jgi:hypothetical protein
VRDNNNNNNNNKCPFTTAMTTNPGGTANCRNCADMLHLPAKNVGNGGRVCARCNQQMIDVGTKFKPPKKSDKKRWKALQSTWQIQQRFVNGEWTRVV